MARGKGSVLGLVFNVVLFLFLEAVALQTLRRSGPLQQIWLSRTIHIVSGSFWGWGDNIRRYFSLDRQNRELAEANLDLTARLLQAEEELAAREGAAFTKEIRPSRDYRYVPAGIAKISRNRQHNYIILDKGAEDGVTPASGIITDRGVVGIVDTVSAHRAYALSLMNAEVAVSCRLGRSGPVGTLSWDGMGSDGALLRGIPLHVEIHPGDTVYTSGFSNMFPKDIPLGVTGSFKVHGGSTCEVKVRLFQDFSTLRHVLVVINLHREEVEALEKKYGGDQV